ncbi:MAG: prepilin-type N-terminal cleavage/methylation domain-containing protein [Candidatus Saccharimonas sp.]
MNRHSKRSSEAGFTIIEALVTIVVFSVFLLAFGTLYISVTKSYTDSKYKAIANDLGYNYLRKYAYAGATPTWFTTCDSTTDFTVNTNAAGQLLEGGSLTTDATDLPTPVSYSVRAYAIYGCSGVHLKKPIRVDATVTYGPNSTIIRHSTLVAY